MPMARRTSIPKSATTADDNARPAQQARLTENDIARRAYELYVLRGREDGGDLDDWLQAERELRAR